MKRKRKAQRPETVYMTTTSSFGVRWDNDGHAFETRDGGPEQRRPDLDFGTPNGDLLIEPWIQDILKGGEQA